jgi:hypothetical protein
VLERLSRARLTAKHRKFIDQPALASLATELQHWAAEPIDTAELLTHLERYERTGLGSDAALLADDCRLLAWSGDAATKELGTRVAENYRNANLRVVVSKQLLNRLLPQPAASQAAVRDTIAGAHVRGQSTTITKLTARLIPDAQRLRVALDASGTVMSDTAATSGPATFYSSGESSFDVRKLFVFSGDTLKSWPAVASADSYYNDLVSLETDFDGVPLFGSLIRGIARNKHEDAEGTARAEVEWKVAARARRMLDAEIEPRLVKANEALEQRVLQPLGKLQMEAVPCGMSTTEQRLTMRLRLAGADQLGAHTPRPQAMSDSVFSFQVHQSALNNLLQKLDLDGRKFTLPELFNWVGKKLSRDQVTLPEDLPENVHVTFAPQDAVRLRCEDGRVEVILSIAELSQGGKKWRNFTARTYYKPRTESLEAQFVRDGIVFLDGEQVRGKPEVVLRGIFAKVMSANRPWSLVDAKLAADPRLQDLCVNQFVVADGWIGLAYGPQRVAQGKPDQRATRGTTAVRK